jgi:hypothetical protein
MASWPELAELKLIENVDSTDFDVTLARALASAITKVKGDVGLWDDDVDEPDDSLAHAALRMAELIADRPTATAENSKDPTYQRLLSGHRRRFGIS